MALSVGSFGRFAKLRLEKDFKVSVLKWPNGTCLIPKTYDAKYACTVKAKSNNINRIITINDDFYLVIYSKWEFEI